VDTASNPLEDGSKLCGEDSDDVDDEVSLPLDFVLRVELRRHKFDIKGMGGTRRVNWLPFVTAFRISCQRPANKRQSLFQFTIHF